jgi:hypothetical protein
MNQNIIETVGQALSLFAMSPTQLAQKAMAVEYERDVLSLYCLCGPPLSVVRFAEIVKEFVASTPHENHSVPGHLEYLLKNKWLVEGLPKEHQCVRLPDCEWLCLSKFLALIEAEKK